MIRVSVFEGGRPEEVGATRIEKLDSGTALKYLVEILMREDAICRESRGFRILIEHPDSKQFILFESPDSDEEMGLLLSVVDWYKLAQGQE